MSKKTWDLIDDEVEGWNRLIFPGQNDDDDDDEEEEEDDDNDE